MNKPRVTICIPAFNEAANIRGLLLALLGQTQKSYILERVRVDSDGSTDDTAEAALSVVSPLVEVRQHTVRRGKVAIIKEQLQCAHGDVLVQLDGDISLPDSEVLERLIKPFLADIPPDMVCGMHWPLPPRTFIERLAYFGADCWESAKAELGEYGDMYNSLGQIRAFSVCYAREVVLPEDVGTFEDTFLYLYAKQKGKVVVMARDAVVNFRLASSYSDYLSQMSRFVIVKQLAQRYFPRSFLGRYEHMTFGLRFRIFVRKFFKYPLYVSLGYAALQTWVKLRARPGFYGRPMWKSAHSSKMIT